MGHATLDYFAATDKGRVRENNEDRYLADPGLGLFVIADGMGGEASGEVASRVAVEAVLGCFRETSKEEVSPEKVVFEAVGGADRAVREAAREDLSRMGMGATVVVAWLPVKESGIWLAHVGDSRAYLFRDGRLTRLTEDHTIYNMLKLAGRLPSEPGQRPPRGVLSQALGGRNPVVPEVRRFEVEEGDIVLLCTDGLTDMVGYDEIGERINASAVPRDICENLIGAANTAGGRDNVTVVAIKIGSAREAGGNP